MMNRRVLLSGLSLISHPRQVADLILRAAGGRR
jgi:hypothetical protein